MTDFFSTIGTIVAAFFILSLAVETILDNFRGVLALVRHHRSQIQDDDG